MANSKFKIIQKTLMVLAIIFAAYIGNVVFFPHAIPSKTYQIIINKDQSIRNIATELETNNIIGNKRIFLWTIRMMGDDKRIAAGLYVLHDSVSMWDIISRLNNGHPDQVSVTIVDGLRFSQIKSYIDNLSNINHIAKNLNEEQLRVLLKIPEPSLEGLLYPSTYFFAPGQSDLEVYQAAYKLMKSKLNSIYAERESHVHYTTPYQMLVFASLIQKETNNIRDMQQVSTVFNNRLSLGMKLQDDPAVFYGLHNIEKIDRKDFAIDTPYNTYLHQGLPPTPICIPSENAIIAASKPLNDPKLLYFIAIGKGETKFTPTFKQHKKMIKKYLKK